MNIAIDGPAGAGKSTIAKLVAKATDSIYVDTGAMYRAMAYYFIQRGIDASDTEAIEGSLDAIDISIRYVDQTQHVILNGEDVTPYLRAEKIGNMASATSSIKKVREKLVELQQKIACENSVVMDGRDIGTVVLPDAEVKVYLTASAHTRALRRYREIREREIANGSKSISPIDEAFRIEKIEKDIAKRDEQDMTREESPLRKAEDAIEVDSSAMTIDEVVVAILDLVDEAGSGTGHITYSK